MVFKVTSKSETNWREIAFEAYIDEKMCADRPYSDPYHPHYRFDKYDFDLCFAPSNKSLLLSSWWRYSFLTLDYRPLNCSWSDEDESISRPYPDGDKFEAMASEMFVVLKNTLIDISTQQYSLLYCWH